MQARTETKPLSFACAVRRRRNDRLVYAAPTCRKGRAPKRNPFENNADAIAAGSKLYAQHCAECHGNRAESGQKGPSLLEDEVQRATAGALF
jgi:mono/diheme cytochrome c family protein